MIKTLSAAVLILASSSVFAADSDKPKRFSLGLASFATAINYTSAYITEDDAFAGPALFGTFALSNGAAVRLTVAEQGHQDYSNLDLSAVEFSLLLGGGLQNKGAKIYASLGAFSETLSNTSGYEVDFSGLMLGAGIGYNWDVMSVEFWVNLRDSSDYDDFVGPYIDATAASGGLGISARF